LRWLPTIEQAEKMQRTGMMILAAASGAALVGMVNQSLAQSLYVTDQQSGVTILDGATLARIGAIAIGGQGARGVAVTHDGKFLLTANQGTGDLSIIDRATGVLSARVPIGPSPEMVRSDAHTAYVTYEPRTGKDDLAQIAIVDIDRHAVTRTVPSGHETEGIAFSADGKAMLVANEGDNTVSVYALPGATLTQKIETSPYGTRPRGINRSPDGDTYVVSLELSNKILVLDRSFSVIRSVATDDGPYGVAYSPYGTRLFVAAARAGLIQAFDAKTFAHISDIPVGKRCWHFSFTADTRRIVAACGRSEALFVVDAISLKPLQSIAGFKMPWGVVAYPNTSGTLDTR
jgi:DNA-binding beta-propeller fold protein YncE